LPHGIVMCQRILPSRVRIVSTIEPLTEHAHVVNLLPFLFLPKIFHAKICGWRLVVTSQATS